MKKIIIQSAIAVTAVCLLAGCETTGLSPREAAGASYPSYIMSLPAADNGKSSKPSLPIRLAVAQIGEVAPPQIMLDKFAAQKTLIASETSLPLPSDLNRSFDSPDYANRIKTLCKLARVSGADYVFLFGGNVDTWQQDNFLTAFDITIVGGMLLPGTTIHVEGKGAGVLISAATGQPLFFVSSEAKNSAGSADLLADGKKTAVQIKVRDELFNKLSGQFLSNLADSASH